MRTSDGEARDRRRERALESENRRRSQGKPLQVLVMHGDRGRQSAREAEKRRRSPREMRTRDGTAEDPRRTSRGPATGISTCKDIESQVAGKAVAGPSNAWGPGTAERMRGRKASQVTKGIADRGRHGRGPATHQPRTSDSTAEDQRQHGRGPATIVAGPHQTTPKNHTNPPQKQKTGSQRSRFLVEH